MNLVKFIKLETKKVLGRRYFTIALVFLAASGYFIQFGIGQYKHTLEERDNFLEFELLSYKQFVYPSMYGNYGLRLLFEPSPMTALFDSGVPVPPNMTSIIDGSERMKVYHSLKGQGGFALIASAFMTFGGFILMFGSGFVILFGFFGAKDHEWLKFLEDSTSRKKLFFYLLISKAFILLLFCLALAGLSLLLFLINRVAINPSQVLIISLVAFGMLLCFLLMGLATGTLRNRFCGWILMIIAWFVFAFLIPILMYHLTYGRATSIQSPYKMEAQNLKLFAEYEKGSLEKGGKFDQSKRGNELEKEMFIIFWEGGMKKAMRNEEDMINEMKENTSFFQNLAALFPTTFFLSVNTEISSRGFANLTGFYEYARQKKKDFIWYLAQNYILSTQMVFPPFIRGSENIYQGQSQLPGNFNFGLAVTIIWIIAFLSLYWIVFNLMLDHALETKRNLNPEELTKNQTNFIFTSDKGLLPQLIAKLRLQNISFLSIPAPASLPGDTKVKNLFSFFDLAVPEALQEIDGKYVYTLDPDQKGKVLAEIARSLKADVIIFDNFLAGLSDEIIHYFAGVLKSLKKDCTIVYFTNSLMVTTLICDPVNDHIHKWTKEQIAF